MIAAGFIAQGAKVYISSRKADVCDAVAEELGPNCISLPQDVSTVAGCQMLADAYFSHEKSLDILVNNAGAAWGEDFSTFPESGWDKVMNVNVRGVFFLTQKLLPLLRAAASADDPARIINTGSVNGLTPPGMDTFSYSSSKAAVHMLTRHLGKELAPDHITVNAIAPGPFDSNMMAFALNDPNSRAAIASGVPMGRIGMPDDMAGVAIYLASAAGAYVTGAVVPVGGGLSTITE